MRLWTTLCVLAVATVAGCNSDRDRRDLTSPTRVEKLAEKQSPVTQTPSPQDLPIEDAKGSIKTETDGQATAVRFVSECLGPESASNEAIGDF